MLTIGILQTNWGQNWLAKQVVNKLSKDLQTHIEIKKVEFGLFNRMDLEGVLIEDHKKDTLLWAGTVQVRITDWFFFKDKADLKYIGLKDAKININRTHSTWNYQFLSDYFASPTTGKKKKSGIEFNLKKVLMDNVSFNKKDAWTGSDLYAKVSSLNVDANNISLSNKIIDVDDIVVVDPYIQTFNYKGNKTTSEISANNEEPGSPASWNPENWKMNIASITIKDGQYRSDRNTLTATTKYFDGQHLNFSAINGTIKKLYLNGDTLRSAIDISTKERSGLVVKTLRSNLRINPQIMEFDDLYLQTNRSELGNYFAMKFDDISSMNDFIHAVNMEANFINTNVSSDDIAFFAPSIIDWNKNIQLKGKVTGTVDDLSGTDVVIGAGNNSSLIGDFSLVGLPNINETFINVRADELRTTYADAVVFAPALKKVTMPNIRKLSYLRFNGSFTGFINDFVTYGTLNTALGTLVSDVNMKLPKGAEPVYSGSLSTTNFQLGQFLNNNDLGIIAFNGDVKGKSFNWKKLDATIDGKVEKIFYNDYTYQNITVKGKLKNRTFNGYFNINDPNADLSLTGLIDLSGETPEFDVVAKITELNLQRLNLTENELTFNGDVNFNFTGKNLSDFLGNARVSNATLFHDGKRLSFDSLIFSSNVVNGIRTLNARSNEFDATVTGNFNLQSLPDAFTLFLNQYYPSYIKAPRRTIETNQAFTFNITTGVIDDYIKLIDPRLSGFNNSQISGSLNVAANSLLLDANVPQFAWEQYSFSDVKLKGDGNFERLIISGEVNNATISDSLRLPLTTFTVKAENDVSDITINTTANQTLNKADLSAQIKTFTDGISIKFNPSSFIINGKTWNIEQGGELDFRSNADIQGQLVLKESNQEIRLRTHPSDVGNWTDLLVSLQNINIGDISPFFIKTNRVEGLLSGEVRVEDPQKRLNITSSLAVDQLRLDDDSIGQVQALVNYNNATGALTAAGNNLDPEHKILFDVDIDLKDSANKHTDRISVQPIKYPVKILERFLGNLFSDMQGYLTGKLDIIGEGTNRDYIGKGRLTDAALKVNFTQVKYKIADTDINLTKNEINLGTLKLLDTTQNATATVQGSIKHNSFKNMFFDITAKVDDDPMLLINTNYHDNQQFYGRAIGTGSMTLYGPQYDMAMSIVAKASENDSSYITLPPSRSRESGLASFMVERKYGREMTEEDFKGSATNITYDVDLTANPLVNIEVILDDLTGDVIRGRGTGNLFIRGGTSEPLSIRGRYDIEEGSYRYTFQTIFKKPFVINPNSVNFIEWTGDPYTAKINFDAIYKAEDVSFAPLVSGLIAGDTRDISNYRGDVMVIAKMTGELFKPVFNFKLQFPPDLYRNINPATAFSLQQGIQQIESNPNEINKQVTYLIVFNSFAPYQNNQNTSYRPFDELAYSTISGLFFGEVNRRLNQLLSGILKNNDLTINFTGSLYNSNLLDNSNNNFDINQSEFNVSIGKALFNERIIVTLGGTFDVPLQSDIEQTVQLFKDVNVQFLINKSGSIRANIFYAESPLIGSSLFRTQRAGANLSYRKEFDSLTEFFFGRKKGNKLPADSTVKDSIPTSGQ